MVSKEERCDSCWSIGLLVVQCHLKHSHTGPHQVRVQDKNDKVPAVIVW